MKDDEDDIKQVDDETTEEALDRMLADSMAAKLRSNVDDDVGGAVTREQSNLQAILVLLNTSGQADLAVRILEHCAGTFNPFSSDELVREMTPWAISAIAVVTQGIPDCLVDSGRFNAALRRCEPMLKRAIELTFH